MKSTIHLAYASAATIPFSEAMVRELLSRARAHNASINVTGILLYTSGSFFQLLEGEADVVEPLFARIQSDTRHRRISTLVREPIDEREFEDWSMGFASATPKDLATVPGFNAFFVKHQTLDHLSEGLARRLLTEFRRGQWRMRIEK